MTSEDLNSLGVCEPHIFLCTFIEMMELGFYKPHYCVHRENTTTVTDTVRGILAQHADTEPPSEYKIIFYMRCEY